MKSRNLINLLLLIVILALGAVAYLRPGLEEPETETLTPLSITDIHQLTLKTSAASIPFEKSGDTWWIADSPRILADKLQLQQLIDIAHTVPVRSYPVTELAPDKLGITDGSPAISINDMAFTIGKTDPLNNLRYLQQGDRVYLIRDSLANFIDARRTQFASRNLFPDNTAIQTISLDGFDEMPADQRNQFIQYWETAQAIWVRSLKTESEWGQSIIVTLADDSRINFQLRYEGDDLVLGRPDWGVEYHMGSAAKEQLMEISLEKSPE